MKLTKLELTGLALFILFIVYLYYNPLKTQPVYYPVYKTQYVPVNRPSPYPVYPRPRPFPHPRPGHHHGNHHLKPWHVNPTRKYPGGVIPVEPLK